MSVANASAGQADSVFRPGIRVDSYLIERVIGEGGMGAVFYARHTGLDKPVAIKALHPELAKNDIAVARFLREGRALSKIRHPHVIDVTDVGTHEGIPYLVMEYLEGEDLEKRLERLGRLPTNEIARIMLPVLDALATAHEASVVHRDLKPSNIFLARTARGHEVSMVLDFGIAKIIDQPTLDEKNTLTRAATFMGTPYYSSPEQARSVKHVDARSDQYSLGAILYELSSGDTSVATGSPFEVLVCIVANKVRPLRSVQPDVDPQFEALVHRAIAFKPEDRYADVREMGRALLEFADKRVRGEWERAFGVAPSLDANTPFVEVDATGYVTSDSPFSTTLPSQPDDIAPDTIEDRSLGGSRPARGPRLTLGGVTVSREHLAIGAMVVVVTMLAFSVLVALIALVFWPDPPPPIVVTVLPVAAEIELDGVQVGERGAFEVRQDDTAHEIRVTAPGYVAYEARLAPGEAPPTTIVLEPVPTPEPDLEIGGGIETADPAASDPPPESPSDPIVRPNHVNRGRPRINARRVLRHLR